MSEDFEGHTNDPQEAIQMFAEQVIEASGYVLEGAFRSVTIEGDLIALFMNRDPENLGKSFTLLSTWQQRMRPKRGSSPSRLISTVMLSR